MAVILAAIIKGRKINLFQFKLESMVVQLSVGYVLVRAWFAAHFALPSTE